MTEDKKPEDSKPATRYFRLLIWRPEDDAIVRLVYERIFGRAMLQKSPLQSRWKKKLMIGTAQMTAEKEAQLKSLLGKKIEIREKKPRLWRDAKPAKGRKQ